MNCEHVKELLSAYLDKALALEEESAVTAHLATCTECRRVLADFRRFDALLTHLPRVSPDPALYTKIFSSPAYLEVTGTDGTARTDAVPSPRSGSRRANRPHLVALPGGRQRASFSEPPVIHTSASVASQGKRQSKPGTFWWLRTMRISVVATLLVILGVGSLIGWKLWQTSESAAQATPESILPPSALQAGPIPAGMRFVFLRDGSLWSGSPTGNSGVLRLTPDHVTVAPHWAIRPAQPAGNMLAYIDLRQGLVHLVRSDGQLDTSIKQSLLKPGVQPASIWDTAIGVDILESLSWSPDGTMLAFLADPEGVGKPHVYIATVTGEVHAVTLPFTGAAFHPVWSPDSLRVAFAITHDSTVSIIDYNTQNQGLLTLVPQVNTPSNSTDTVLSLDWAPTTETPTVTWSVGTTGHVHSIWLQHLGVVTTTQPSQLISGDYERAIYNPAGHHGTGCWLLVTLRGGLPSDLVSADLAANVTVLTSGKQVSTPRWSPDGSYVDFFDGLASGFGTLHVVNTTTTTDKQLATVVASDPAPAWSPDTHHLAYSTGSALSLATVQTANVVQFSKLQGTVSALSWSVTAPKQVIVATSDRHQGIYTLDTQHDTAHQLDTGSIRGPIQWQQVP